MAFAVRNQENGLAEAVREGTSSRAGGKAGSLLEMGSKRRAPLGDVSNSLAAPRVGVQQGKAGPAKPQEATKPPPAAKAPIPRAAPPAVQLQQPVIAPSRSNMAPPRTRSQTKGLSMSSMLQNRSEAAIAPRGTGAPPAFPLPDIDALDRSNPLAVTDYINDIQSYYRRAEPKYRVAPDYMKNQRHITDKMRGVLIDWLVEVHHKFKLQPETLFLTVNLLDRFLERKEVTKPNLQLVGVTAMLIASKYEEVWAPEVRDFVHIADRAYTREQILACERLILNTLKFHLTLPSIHNFLARFLKASDIPLDQEAAWVACYVAELSLIDGGMLKHSYSTIAAAAVYIALKGDAYPKALARHSTYSLRDVLPCAAQLVELMKKAPTNSLGAIYKKHSSVRFLEVAKMPPPLAIIEEARHDAMGAAHIGA